jgi:hypothetical protein
MQHPITPRAHGVLDYATSVATAAAPTLLGFPKPAAALCYALAGGYTGSRCSPTTRSAPSAWCRSRDTASPKG